MREDSDKDCGMQREDQGEPDLDREPAGSADQPEPSVKACKRRRPFQEDDRKRNPFIREGFDKIRRGMNSLHSRAGVESLTLVIDPSREWLQVHSTPGLLTLERDLDLRNKGPIFMEYQRGLQHLQDYMSRRIPLEDPVRFSDIVGGERTQRLVTAELLRLALPHGASRSFLQRTSAEQLRGMTSTVTGASYSSWPKDLVPQRASQMELADLERAYTWAIRWLGSQDTRTLVDQLASAKVLVSDDQQTQLTEHWHRAMAARLVRGVVGDEGDSPYIPPPPPPFPPAHMVCCCQ